MAAKEALTRWAPGGKAESTRKMLERFHDNSLLHYPTVPIREQRKIVAKLVAMEVAIKGLTMLQERVKGAGATRRNAYAAPGPELSECIWVRCRTGQKPRNALGPRVELYVFAERQGAFDLSSTEE